jgi:hypothetical protein
MPWTKMRACTLGISLVCAAVVGAMYFSAIAYTGDFDGNEEFWLIFFCGCLSGTGYLIAHVRDQINDRIDEKQSEIRQEIEDLSLHLADFGEQREVAGHMTAMKVTRRHLGSVDS